MITPEHVKQTLAAIGANKTETKRTPSEQNEVSSNVTLADTIMAHRQLYDARREQGYSDLPPARSPEDYEDPDPNAYGPFTILHNEHQRQDEEISDYLKEKEKKAAEGLGRAALNARIAQLRANDTPKASEPTEDTAKGPEYTVDTRTGDVLIGADLRKD